MRLSPKAIRLGERSELRSSRKAPRRGRSPSAEQPCSKCLFGRSARSGAFGPTYSPDPHFAGPPRSRRSGGGSSDSRWCSLIAPRIHGAIPAITGGCDTRFRGLSFSPLWQCPALALLAWRKPARRNRVAPPLLPSLKQASNPTSAPYASMGCQWNNWYWILVLDIFTFAHFHSRPYAPLRFKEVIIIGIGYWYWQHFHIGNILNRSCRRSSRRRIRLPLPSLQ